jgi:DNA polymerase III sliding clamp (beta) subunit (PCNA family)
MVCTDGKILAVADVALEAPAQEMVISPIAMERLKAMVKDCTGDTVTLEHYKSGFVGRCGHRVFASANAGGEFPRKYRSIIPTEGTRLDALVADVIGATKRNMLASTQKDVDLSLTLSQDGLTVESDAGREIVPAFCAAPSPVTVKVSGKYLIGALQACPHERVELLKSAGPLLMTPLAGDLSWKAVIGPVSKS